MEFQHPEYYQFFEDLLCAEGESLILYESLFDFRPLDIKRREYMLRRKALLPQLLEVYGKVCQLRCSDKCNIERVVTIDHIIPLYTNQLNKRLKKTKALAGKKVQSESFGSNHLSNLILACKDCNNHKKHRFLSKESIRRILAVKAVRRGIAADQLIAADFLFGSLPKSR